MDKIWQDAAWADDLYWQTQDKKTLKKINRLLQSIDRSGYDCQGQPEPLKGDLSGFWSVRIDAKNRIVFGLRITAWRLHNVVRTIGTNEQQKRRQTPSFSFPLALSLPLTDVPVGIHLEVGALFLPRVFVLEHDGVIE